MSYMKQTLCLIWAVVLLSAFPFVSAAQVQDVQPLPNDPRVKTGKLANGLTYYVIKNAAVKGHADFAVAQKVGTSLEKNGQKGMCRMIELLSTRGTRNFTDSTIVEYLNSIGVGSNDIRFSTGADEIVYTVERVPVQRENTVDSTLLILYNWMASINIDEEDVARTMPMLKKTLIDQWDAQARIDDKVIKELYPKSPYAQSMTPEQINGLKTYSSKELRNFYYRWFRPDLQAVFVVGDIDPAKVETQIKSIFATIPKPIKAEKRTWYKGEPVKGTQVMMVTDPEYDKTSISISFQRVPLEEKYKNTSVPYIEAYFDEAISTLLLSRIQSGIVEQNLPVSNVRVQKGRFMEMNNLDAFTISFETLPEAVYPSLGFMSGEINRMAKSGFNNQEFRSTIESHFRSLESVYDTRLSQPNSLFMERAMENWFRGFSLGSIELHFEIMKEILYSPNLRTEQLNSYAAALLGQKEGVVISCCMPQADGIEELSVARIQNAFLNSLSKTEYMASVDKMVSWPKFDTPDKQGELLSEVSDPVTGATIFTLNNGVKVVFKEMGGMSDTISFGAASKGGMSVEGSGLGRDINLYISDIANLSAVGGHSKAVWDKLFSYNNMYVSVGINDYMEQIRGYCTSASLEKLFHFINMSFTQRQSDYNAFDVYRKGKSFEARYRKLSPAKVFEDSVSWYNSGNRRYLPSYSVEYIDQMDYYKVLTSIKRRFGNPADFVFVFAGNTNIDQVREYAVKYLGSLASSHDREEWFVTPNYAAKGVVSRSFLHQMVLPRTFVDATLSCGMQNTQKNRALGILLEEYLKSLSGYGIIKELSPESSVSAGMEFYPEEIMLCKARFETDSAGAQQILDVMNAKLMEIAYNGISADEFAVIKKNGVMKMNNLMQDKEFWVKNYLEGHLLGKDLYSGFMTVLEGVTAADFKEFVDKLCRRGNRITVVMEGTTQDVNTQNLFRENQFIREYFDL